MQMNLQMFHEVHLLVTVSHIMMKTRRNIRMNITGMLHQVYLVFQVTTVIIVHSTYMEDDINIQMLHKIHGENISR